MIAGALRPSARLRQLLARATCILADPSIPDAYPDDVLSDVAGEQWPFERAQFRLECGQWLRRQRRINQAKETLSAAHDAFSAVGARPWADQAAAELRACGISVRGAVTSASGLSALTPQQREIIELAAQGLSNREIAQRLVLSPRTVASHLHRSFPKLGVSGRRQLHALVAAASNAGLTDDLAGLDSRMLRPSGRRCGLRQAPCPAATASARGCCRARKRRHPSAWPRRAATPGGRVWSSSGTMYQLGVVRHAAPGALCRNRSAAGANWVAQTTRCSSSGTSPATQTTPDGSSQARPSAISMCWKTGVTGNLSCWPCDVSASSGASAAM